MKRGRLVDSAAGALESLVSEDKTANVDVRRVNKVVLVKVEHLLLDKSLQLVDVPQLLLAALPVVLRCFIPASAFAECD